MLGFELGLSCSVLVAMGLVPRPVGFFAFTGAISCILASTAIHCVAAFRYSIGEFAMWAVATAQLCDRLDFFVLLFQTGAGDAMPEEFHHVQMIVHHVTLQAGGHEVLSPSERFCF
jgi:hypothetical protein